MKVLANVTGKDVILKDVCDFVLKNDETQLKDMSRYIYSYWRDMSVKHGFFPIDD